MKQTINNTGIPFEIGSPNERLKDAIDSESYTKFDNDKEGLDWLNE